MSDTLGNDDTREAQSSAQIICECGDAIWDHDDDMGCMGNDFRCPCMLSQEIVEARYWARKMKAERDALRKQLDAARETINVVSRWLDEYRPVGDAAWVLYGAIARFAASTNRPDAINGKESGTNLTIGDKDGKDGGVK